MPRQKHGRTLPKSCTQELQAGASKGAIATLQEFVQCSHKFQVPSNYSVLQWSFDSKMADAATLEFRAIVAFLYEGVPHHVVGTWQPKKKDAQRDAADRALGLFVGRWGTQISGVAQNPTDNHMLLPSGAAQEDEEMILAEHCRHSDACGGIPPSWSVQWEGNACRATVEMTLLGVTHQFAGAAQTSEEAARADAARRLLFYLQCPGFQDSYEPDPSADAVVTRKIPPPPANWAHDSVAEGALEVAERKTAIMRLQNRLQQTFSHNIRPGLSVWSWSYETDPDDEDWPVLSRASVTIPVIGKTFTGDWLRGQRDAQLNAIQQVSHVLDELEFSSQTNGGLSRIPV